MLCALCLVRHSVWYVLRMMKSDDFLVSRLSAGVTYPWEVLAHLYTFPPLFLLTVSLGLLRGVPLFRLPTYWAAYPSLLFPALFRTERRYSTCALLVFSCLVPLTLSPPDRRNRAAQIDGITLDLGDLKGSCITSRRLFGFRFSSSTPVRK